MFGEEEGPVSVAKKPILDNLSRRDTYCKGSCI